MPPPGKKLAAALVLLTLTMAPELVLAGVSFLQHHHGPEFEETLTDPTALADLAETLVHGHHHDHGVPDHEHHWFPGSPVHHEALRNLEMTESALSVTPARERLSPSTAAPPRSPPRADGTDPPLRLSLCTLLI